MRSELMCLTGVAPDIGNAWIWLVQDLPHFWGAHQLGEYRLLQDSRIHDSLQMPKSLVGREVS